MGKLYFDDSTNPNNQPLGYRVQPTQTTHITWRIWEGCMFRWTGSNTYMCVNLTQNAVLNDSCAAQTHFEHPRLESIMIKRGKSQNMPKMKIPCRICERAPQTRNKCYVCDRFVCLLTISAGFVGHQAVEGGREGGGRRGRGRRREHAGGMRQEEEGRKEEDEGGERGAVEEWGEE